MTTVIIITKIMPDSPEADLEAIKEKARTTMEAEGAKNISFEEKLVAFGLKSIHMKIDMPEEKGSDIVESKLAEIEHVSSITIEDYRRAFG